MSDRAESVVSSLVKNGRYLAKSLDEAKTGPDKEKLDKIHEGVSTAIFDVLKQLQHTQELPAIFRENGIPKILDKIVASLAEFKEIDTDKALDYDQLVNKLNDSKYMAKAPVVSSSSPSSVQPPSGDSSQQPEAWRADEDCPTKEQFITSLSSDQKKCLFCFCLFPAGAEVKKREPIHLWSAMGLVNDDDDYDRLSGATMLANLVAEGYIIDRPVPNRYKMNHRVRSMVIDAMNINFAKDVTTLSVMDQNQPLAQGQHDQQQPRQQSTKSNMDEDVINGGLGTLVLNIGVDRLQATAFQNFEMKHDINVLHLGSWLHDSDRYVIVQVETLKGLLKHKGEIKFLSLEGVSGIVELPNYVYKLENLKVLDLRGCPNLESLSEGIDSLKQLTHLDLSECYLLDGIPKGITSLTELRVLKGFIINPELGNNENKGSNTSYSSSSSSSSCASFSDLKILRKLVKLTIRTRRKSFPTCYDFHTLRAMNKLATLRVAWVLNSKDDPIRIGSERFPPSLKKLELQGASNDTVLQLLSVVSEDSRISLQKLYIRGGRLKYLGSEMLIFRHVQTVRLRYLSYLSIEWDKFRKFFPNITRLEVWECPNLIFFPCGENGVWEKTSTK